MGWLYLTAAIAAEILATVCLKLSGGLTRLVPTLGVAVGYTVAFVALSQAVKTVELGTSYAIWSACGTTIIALVGILFLGESADLRKLAGIALVILGVVLLSVAATNEPRTVP